MSVLLVCTFSDTADQRVRAATNACAHLCTTLYSGCAMSVLVTDEDHA